MGTLESLLGRYGRFFCVEFVKKVLKIAIFADFLLYIYETHRNLYIYGMRRITSFAIYIGFRLFIWAQGSHNMDLGDFEHGLDENNNHLSN